MGKKSMEAAPALAHKEHRQGLPMHHLAWLEDDAPRWSLSLESTMLHATGPHHPVPAETGSRGCPEPWTPPPPPPPP